MLVLYKSMHKYHMQNYIVTTFFSLCNSLCRLETRFAVRVYGAVPEKNLTVLGWSLLTLTIIVTAILVSSYMYLRVLHTELWSDE